MNIINITQQQLDNIFIWRDKNKDLVRTFLPYLTDGEIHLIPTDKDKVESRIYFEVDTQNSSFEDKEFIIKLKLILDTDIFEVKFMIANGQCICLSKNKFDAFDKFDKYMTKQTGSHADEREMIQSLLAVFCAVNAYFFHYRQDISALEQKEVKKHLIVGKGNKAHYEIIKRLNKTYTIVGKIHKNKVPIQKQWRLDCWNVVGHIRHYANGKTAYVRPYKKGKNRNKDFNKIYEL